MSARLRDLTWIGLMYAVVSLSGCGAAPPPPIESSDYAGIEFVTLGDRAPMPDVLELKPGTGVFAEVRLEPRPSLPTSITDRKAKEWAVQPPAEWGVMVVVYPQGYEEQPEGRYACGFERYSPLASKQRSIPTRNPGSRQGWIECGFVAPPQFRRISRKATCGIGRT